MKMQQIKEQYATSKNLEARMSIYRYAVDPKTFSQWLTEQIDPGRHLKILELGCGTGAIWHDLKASFPDSEILLSDLSAGMLAKAKENLGEKAFSYEIIDFHHIPYPKKTFDVVISNHNLYHAVDLDRVLSEIARVLKEDGVFYSTTNGADHLARLRELIGITDDRLWPNHSVTSAFGAETGMEILSNYFPYAERRDCENELRITDLDVILDYFRSVRLERVHHIINQSLNQIQERFNAESCQYGCYQVKTKGCLFICRKSSF